MKRTALGAALASCAGGTRVVASAMLSLSMVAAAQSAWAAKNWTGNKSSDFSTSGNWSGSSGRRYFWKSNLTGECKDFIFLSKSITETSNTGLCFGDVPDSGYWRFQGLGKYTFANSGNTGTDYDQDLVCIGYGGTGSKVRFYAVTLNTRHLTVGGDATLGGHKDTVKFDMTGHLILDDLDDNAVAYLGPVVINATKTCDFYKGDLYATNANITCSGAMQLCNFVVDKTGGDWKTTGGDLKIGNGGGTSTIIQRSGTFEVASGRWTRFENGSTGTLNLDGGTFKTKLISDESATSASIVFNGGTLEANAYDARGLVKDSSINVTVEEGGATVNTGGLTPILNAAFNNADGVAGDLTVTGGGSATFTAMGDLTGVFTVGEDTTLRWFDQDGVVSNYTVAALNLAPGATLYLNADATGCDTFEAATTNITATAENPAKIKLILTSIPAPAEKFALFEVDDADKITVEAETPAGASLEVAKTCENGVVSYSILAREYTWNDGTSGSNWSAADKWLLDSAAATWADNNIAVFATAGDSAALDSDVTAVKLDFQADATVLAGGGTLTVPSVSVVPSVSATIAAPTAGTLEKTGAGTLTLGVSRTDQTTLAEGTLAMADGATVDGTKFMLGTDAAKPVTFDYGGQTLTANPTAYLGAGMDVTLTNGTFTYTASVGGLSDENTPATLTIAKDAVFTTSNRYVVNTDSEKTINIVGGELDFTSLSSSQNAWLMQNSSGTLRIDATNALLKAYGHVYAGTGHESSDLSPKVSWRMVDSSLSISGNGLFLGNKGNQTMSKYPVTPQVTFAMTNGVFYAAKGFILGQDPSENTSQTAGWYIAEFDHCIVTSKLCRVYGDRPLSRIHFNGTTLVSNGAGSEWIDAVGFADGTTPVTVGADGLTLDNNGNAMTLAANLGGTGALTFTGSAATTLAAGVAIAPPATVANGTTLTLTGTAQTTIGALTLEAGSTLNIASYTAGVTPLAVTTLTAPADGTATLTYAGGAFSTGTYKILEKSGITAADVGNLVPSTGGETYSYSVSGNTLVLTVGSTVHGRWRASAGSGDFSNPDN